MVRMSASLTWSYGSSDLTPFEKSSWKTKLIRAPPESSFKVRSPDVPSMAVRNSEQNSVMMDRITLPC